jgi:hypothetical protein
VSIGIFLFGSCSGIKTAPYDQYSYQKAVEIKVDASRLMDKATTPYEEHTQEADNLLTEMEKMVVYKLNRPNNEISYRMWQLQSDADKNLLAGFLKKWNEKGKFSQAFLDEAKPQVMEAMNILIQYEGRKDKQAESSLMDLILANQ